MKFELLSESVVEFISVQRPGNASFLYLCRPSDDPQVKHNTSYDVRGIVVTVYTVFHS